MTPELNLSRDPAHLRHGSTIGQPLSRVDGLAKVTGRARYAADNNPSGMLYAVLAVSSIARGRVVSLDVDAAKAHPGVVAVMTSANRPPLQADPDGKPNPFAFRFEALQNDRVRYANQPIAVVIAESLEAATEGAALLAPRYQAEPARIGLDTGEAYVPPVVGMGFPAESHHGDAAAALAGSDKRITATYETPAHYHNAMEPHAIVAEWQGDRLIIDTPTQGLVMMRARLAELFGIAPENILIRSPYLGGGFGGKGLMAGAQVLGILAAKLVDRPVKLVARREQLYGPFGHRSPTRQTLKLGANATGQLSAIHHHARIATSSFEDFYEAAAHVTHTLYAAPAISTTYDAVRMDTGTPLFVRAPGIAPGSIALESAVDEMAEACGLDPLAFRVKNYAEVEPATGKPFSSKALRDCYTQGAERFGWWERPLKPRTMRDKDGFLVGWGMGTATFHALMFAGQARAVIRRDDEGRGESYAEILARAGLDEVEGSGAGMPDPAANEHYAMHSHGAVFAEVKVDPDLGQVRVTRMIGAFAAGRIINPKLVRSQLIGGMIWGVSLALHEEAIIDHRSGRIMNANLGEYHVPVNADIPAIEAFTVDEHDPFVNPLGIKGVGEIGITGSAGAVANAVAHATGIRVRRFPVRISDLVPPVS